jgi:Zn-dependent M32 family carboxypeptidase
MHTTHRKGSLYASADELMLEVTGKALDPQVYTTYYILHTYITIYVITTI